MQRATAPAARAAAAAAGARPIAHSISSTSPRSNVNQVRHFHCPTLHEPIARGFRDFILVLDLRRLNPTPPLRSSSMNTSWMKTPGIS